MSGFINYNLINDIDRVVDAGVVGEIGDDSQMEERHISELDRRMAALDEKEAYVVTKALVKYHRETFVKTLEDIEKEGEIYEGNQ